MSLTSHNRVQSESVACAEAGGVVALRCIAIAGDYPANAAAPVYGISRTAAASGEMVTVDVLGVLEAEAGGAIAAGIAVQSGADGRLEAHAGNNFVVGYSLTAAAAAGDTIKILRGV